MALPLAEQILAAAETRLNELSQAAGYNYDYANNGPGKKLRKIEHPHNFNSYPVVLLPPADERQPSGETAGTVQTTKNERVRVLQVLAFAKSSNFGTQLSLIRQDVERALIKTESPILGVSGITSINLITVEEDQDPENENLEFLLLTFHVTYRYTRGDP